jgi:hypothetical protein
MRQFCNTEPRFTIQEENDILFMWQMYEKKSPEEYEKKRLSKYHFSRIFRSLSNATEGMKYERRLERWLQAKCLIDPSVVPGPHAIAEKMKIMFDAVGDTFVSHYKPNVSKQKNVPRLDIMCLIFLYNIDPELLKEFGWIFLTREICLCSESAFKNWESIKLLLEQTNAMYARVDHRKDTVREETILLFRRDEFSFQIPELEDLRSMACKSEMGMSTLDTEICWFAVK